MSHADELLREIFAENAQLAKLSRNDFREYLSDRDIRISYAFRRLRYCLAADVYFPTRAFTGAGKIVGSKTFTPLYDLKRAFRTGNYAELKEKMPDHVPQRNVGHVYFAIPYGSYDRIKIGFSIDWSRRVDQLGVKTLVAYPGTLLDEHVFHCANASTRETKGEWFFKPTIVPPEIYERIDSRREHDEQARARERVRLAARHLEWGIQ